MNSKYYKSFPEYIEAHPEIDEKQLMIMGQKFQTYEEMLFSFTIYLCL